MEAASSRPRPSGGCPTGASAPVTSRGVSSLTRKGAFACPRYLLGGHRRETDTVRTHLNSASAGACPATSLGRSPSRPAPPAPSALRTAAVPSRSDPTTRAASPQMRFGSRSTRGGRSPGHHKDQPGVNQPQPAAQSRGGWLRGHRHVSAAQRLRTRLRPGRVRRALAGAGRAAGPGGRWPGLWAGPAPGPMAGNEPGAGCPRAGGTRTRGGATGSSPTW